VNLIKIILTCLNLEIITNSDCIHDYYTWHHHSDLYNPTLLNSNNIPISAGLNSWAVWGTYCLRSLEYWDRRFESCSGHGCVSAFVYVVLSSV